MKGRGERAVAIFSPRFCSDMGCHERIASAGDPGDGYAWRNLGAATAGVSFGGGLSTIGDQNAGGTA